MPHKNKEKQRAATRAWFKNKYANDPAYREKIRLRNRQSKIDDPNVYRNAHRRKMLKRYNAPFKDYDEAFTAQDNRCLCCGTDTDTAKNGWHIDHDHSTGKYRGILCSRCNIGLSYFEKSKELFEKYLLRGNQNA